jgi:DNA polymerase zeta
MQRAATIMRSGTVMQTRFRVFESHLSYSLQFMSDFGLYGCGWIDLAEVWERGEVAPEGQERGSDEGTSFKSSPYFRQSLMSLEVDVSAHQILNRHLLEARNIYHKLDISAVPISKEPLVLSVRELWEDERSRRQAEGLSPTPDIPVDPSENSREADEEWIAEARWWDEIKRRVEKESMENVVREDTDQSWEQWVMTTFESVEALWEEEWRVWKPGGKRREDGLQNEEENPFGVLGTSMCNHNESVVEAEVDENMLTSQEMSQLVEREDAVVDDREEDDREEDPLQEDGPLDLQNEDDEGISATRRSVSQDISLTTRWISMSQRI